MSGVGEESFRYQLHGVVASSIARSCAQRPDSPPLPQHTGPRPGLPAQLVLAGLIKLFTTCRPVS